MDYIDQKLGKSWYESLKITIMARRKTAYARYIVGFCAISGSFFKHNEIEKNNSVPFLDILIRKKSGKIETTVYRKKDGY